MFLATACKMQLFYHKNMVGKQSAAKFGTGSSSAN